MKTLHERMRDGKKHVVRSGYEIRACRRCGMMVVHVLSTGEPVHMHRFSYKCRAAGERRGIT